MTLEILQVAGCPGADLLEARLAGLGRPALRVVRRVVTSQADAERLGMTGSPTLLADGVDPFARPGQPPSISCRLYLDEHGRQRPALVQPAPRRPRATLSAAPELHSALPPSCTQRCPRAALSAALRR